jgi:hypothetical protein
MTTPFLEQVEALRSRASCILQVNDPPPARLFQYTDAGGLIGLLSSRAVWATDARFLNDSSEVSLAREVVAHAASSVDVKTTHARELVAKLVQIEPWEVFMGNLYVASFSTKRDSLSQWRAYGGDGLGYAIGVDTSIKLAPASDPPLPLPPVAHYSKVVYDENGPGGVLWEMVAGMLQVLDHADPASGVARAAFVYDTILNLICSISPTLKNVGFEEEDEWRLVFQNPPATVLESVKFRPNGRGFSPYVSLRWDEPPVVEVVLGPRIPAAEGEHAVWMLLLANEHSAGLGELKAEITRSTVSYRR